MVNWQLSGSVTSSRSEDHFRIVSESQVTIPIGGPTTIAAVTDSFITET
ncbi:8703_t:CDS:2 [Diversispora eburnea]|uniref:8703_t:CDS:1 n=1 Tax=Diversispora eburnea TaxID=1213867 RepID=A0A9N9FNV9_9GLOM|nr:8703_t:CDS:2 [Diversispora eburnea]